MLYIEESEIQDPQHPHQTLQRGIDPLCLTLHRYAAQTQACLPESQNLIAL